MPGIADIFRTLLTAGRGSSSPYSGPMQPVGTGTGGVVGSASGPVTSRFGTAAPAAPIESRPLVDMVRAALQAAAPQAPSEPPSITDQALEQAFATRQLGRPPMLPDMNGVEARPVPHNFYWQPTGTPLDDGVDSRPMPENFYWQPEGVPLEAPAPRAFNPYMPNLPWRASSRPSDGRVQPWAPTSLFDTRY